jgi:hypothetical protein
MPMPVTPVPSAIGHTQLAEGRPGEARSLRSPCSQMPRKFGGPIEVGAQTWVFLTTSFPRPPPLAVGQRQLARSKLEQVEAEEGIVERKRMSSEHKGRRHMVARRGTTGHRESTAADLPAVKVRGIAVKGMAAGGVALRALATGAVAAGAAAVGALAVGAVAVGRLRVGDAAAKKLTVGRLEVDELVIGGRPISAEDFGSVTGRP